MSTILSGRVTSGIGGHAHWMREYADLYEAKTGVRLFPGSLNVVLSEPWHPPPGSLRLEPPEYGVGISLVPCQIGGITAFILRTDKNDTGEGDHPPTVIEVAAPVRLRDALGINDGDLVEVVVR
jgi:riboflavin kinase, archaea type